MNSRLKDAIVELQRGNIIILIDDEDRENEGDLVYASQFSTPDKVNFMIKEGRGLVCTSITKSLANKLNLDLMVIDNNAPYETAFTVSIDSIESKTGISSFERNDTIKLLSDENTTSDNFVKPGHIFPLIAKDNGVLERMGHTEASIDLCKLSNLKSSAVICEIINDDGTMARSDDLFNFANKHSLKRLFISDILYHRYYSEPLVEYIDQSIFSEKIKVVKFKDFLGYKHTAVIFEGNHILLKVVSDEYRSDILNSDSNNLVKLKDSGGVLIFLSSKFTDKYCNLKYSAISFNILKSLKINKVDKIVDDEFNLANYISNFDLTFKKE